jgi:hypothetical protein
VWLKDWPPPKEVFYGKQQIDDDDSAAGRHFSQLGQGVQPSVGR